MAYVYLHIKKDDPKGEDIFYVGLGTDTGGKYKRAKTSSGRNRHWHHIAKKHGWRWHILIDGVSIKDACEYEKTLIAGFKRIIHGGCLVNVFTGSANVEQLENLKKNGSGVVPWNKGKKTGQQVWNKGRKMSPEELKMHSEIRIGMNAGEKHPMWGRKMNGCQRLINAITHIGIPAWNKGVKMDEARRIQNKLGKPCRGVIQIDLSGVEIARYRSLTDAAVATGINKGSISCACTGLRNTLTAGGYKWKYAGELRYQPAAVTNVATVVAV